MCQKKRDGMHFFRLARDARLKRLGIEQKTVATLKHVLLIMADFADRETGDVRASKQTIANVTELSKATVKRTIQKLQQIGVIREVGSRPCHGGHVKVYRLNEPLLRSIGDEMQPNGSGYEPGWRMDGEDGA